jgi:hypothetical protein
MSASIKGLGTSRLRTGPGRDLEEVDVVVPPTAAAVKKVQRYVASESHDGHRFNGEPLCDACVADTRELLDALGLLP